MSNISKVDTTSLIHYNPDEKTCEKVAQVSKKKVKKSLTLYVPENFDIDKITKEFPPDFKFHRDNFIYLVNLITDIPSRNKDVEMDYVPFYSPLIQRRVRDYRKYLDYLVKHGVLHENGQYIRGKKSKSFKFTSRYNTFIKPVEITKPTLIKSIIKFIELEDNSYDSNLNEEKTEELSYLVKWFNDELVVDFVGADNYLKDLYNKDLSCLINKGDAVNRYNKRRIVLLKLQKKEFAFTIDNTAGRLHTILTQLKGDLRQFVKYDNKLLVAVDITNSQPYLSTVLFNFEKFQENKIETLIQLYNKSYITNDTSNPLPYYLSKNVENAQNSNNIKRFVEIVKSGQLYEEFGKILLEKGVIVNDVSSIRKQAKTIIFSSIFSPNQSISYNSAMVIFKENFPDVYEIYRLIKQNEHRTLACLLQNLEAKLILHTACRIISEENPNIPIFTLHDSIITTEGNEEYVYQVLYKVLLGSIGIPPTLKFERWEKVA